MLVLYYYIDLTLKNIYFQYYDNSLKFNFKYSLIRLNQNSFQIISYLFQNNNLFVCYVKFIVENELFFVIVKKYTHTYIVFTVSMKFYEPLYIKI